MARAVSIRVAIANIDAEIAQKQAVRAELVKLLPNAATVKHVNGIATPRASSPFRKASFTMNQETIAAQELRVVWAVKQAEDSGAEIINGTSVRPFVQTEDQKSYAARLSRARDHGLLNANKHITAKGTKWLKQFGEQANKLLPRT